MVDDKLKPADAPAPREPVEARKKFLDSEARLAAEIEKLHD